MPFTRHPSSVFGRTLRSSAVSAFVRSLIAIVVRAAIVATPWSATVRVNGKSSTVSNGHLVLLGTEYPPHCFDSAFRWTLTGRARVERPSAVKLRIQKANLMGATLPAFMLMPQSGQ
jgi:hypothetical protein